MNEPEENNQGSAELRAKVKMLSDLLTSGYKANGAKVPTPSGSVTVIFQAQYHEERLND